MTNIKYNLKNGKVIPILYKINYSIPDKNKDNPPREFQRIITEESQKDSLVNHLNEESISFELTPYPKPSQALLDTLSTKTFPSREAADLFLESGIEPKTNAERIADLEMLVLQLGGIIE